MRDQLAADQRRKRAAQHDQHQKSAGCRRPLLRLETHLDQNAAGAHHRADEVALKAAREREFDGRLAQGGGDRANGIEQHAAGHVAPVAEALDPPLLLQDAEHSRYRIGARRPHQFIRRRVDAARDVAGEKRKDRVVEIVEAGDDGQHPREKITAQFDDAEQRGAGRRGTHADGSDAASDAVSCAPSLRVGLRPPCDAAVALARALRRCSSNASAFSPARRRSR